LFTDFHGNSDVVHRLREMLARDRFPQAVVLSGPAGSGKYTLALMLAKAINCLSPITTDGLPDFCGKCSNCLRIAESEDLGARFEEAVDHKIVFERHTQFTSDPSFDHCFFYHAQHEHLGDARAAIFFNYAESDQATLSNPLPAKQ